MACKCNGGRAGFAVLPTSWVDNHVATATTSCAIVDGNHALRKEGRQATPHPRLWVSREGQCCHMGWPHTHTLTHSCTS